MQTLESLGVRSITLDQLLRGAMPRRKAEQVKASAILDCIREASRMDYRANLTRINSPRVAMEYLRPKIAGLAHEVFGILALNAKGDVIGEELLSGGSATACIVSPREFFRAALRLGAASAIAWHNHPSGESAPSREDVNLTRRLRTAGEDLGIPLADHIVMASDGGTSFRVMEGWDR